MTLDDRSTDRMGEERILDRLMWAFAQQGFTVLHIIDEEPRFYVARTGSDRRSLDERMAADGVRTYAIKGDGNVMMKGDLTCRAPDFIEGELLDFWRRSGYTAAFDEDVNGYRIEPREILIEGKVGIGG